MMKSLYGTVNRRGVEVLLWRVMEGGRYSKIVSFPIKDWNRAMDSLQISADKSGKFTFNLFKRTSRK